MKDRIRIRPFRTDDKERVEAFFARMKGETIPFRIYGREYRIPCDLPASLVLELARCEGDVPPQLVLRAAARIFGEETLNEICAHDDFTMAKLEAMLSWAFETIGGAGGEEGGDREKN